MEDDRNEARRYGAISPVPRQELTGTATGGRPLGSRSAHFSTDRRDQQSASSFDAADVGAYWRILRTRWRIVLGVFTIVVSAVAIGTFMQDPVYRATGMIEIRKQTSEVLPAEAVFQMARVTDQYLETEYEVLRSPALARRVLNDLNGSGAPGLQPLNGPDAGEPGAASPRRADETVELAVRGFQKRLTIDPIRGSRLVRIHFDSEDPENASRTVNAVVSNYTAMRVEAGRAAEASLAQQVDSVRVQLTAAEARLQEYVRGSELLFVDNGAGESENIIHERLRRLQQQLTEAEAERYARQSFYSLAQQQGVEHMESDVLRALTVRLADLRDEYTRLRSTFTEDYPRTRQVRNQLEELEAQLSRERGRIAAAIDGEYRAAIRRQELLRSAFDEQKSRVDQLAGQTAEYHVLKRDAASLLDLFTLLQQKRKEAGVSAALAGTEVGVVNLAAIPQEPIRPLPKKNLQLGVLVGLMLGIGIAFLREITDSTMRTAEEVGSLSDRPILALIPSIDSFERDHQRATFAEAFGTLRTSVLLDVGAPAPRSLLITSTQPQEGKTTISTNLALSMARMGRRVLLVDADIRRPAVHRALKLDARLGLVDYLAGRAEWRALLHRSVMNGLDVLPAGRPPTDPADLLSSGRMKQLMDVAYAEYDVVILDSPALFINAPDARILAPLVEATVLVIRSGLTPRDAARQAMKQVPNLIGVVLNDLNLRHLPAYYQDYASATVDGDREVTRLEAKACLTWSG
jgi:polysaccharide biosynthesis transport protein